LGGFDSPTKQYSTSAHTHLGQLGSGSCLVIFMSYLSNQSSISIMSKLAVASVLLVLKVVTLTAISVRAGSTRPP
jgi:hypothetical protein